MYVSTEFSARKVVDFELTDRIDVAAKMLLARSGTSSRE